MRVRLAGPTDVGAVTAVLDDAAAWLAARGIRQWPERFDRARVEEGVETGRVHVAVRGDDVIGTFALQWADPVVWGDVADHDDAGYVHQLAVRRAAAGTGLGRALLDHAGQIVARAGRRWLRLDCVASNTALRRYYESAGFEHRGDVTAYRPEWATSRFQRLALSGGEC